MINLTVQNSYIQFGEIKQSDVVSESVYMHMFSSAQSMSFGWCI